MFSPVCCILLSYALIYDVFSYMCFDVVMSAFCMCCLFVPMYNINLPRDIHHIDVNFSHHFPFKMIERIQLPLEGTELNFLSLKKLALGFRATKEKL